MLPFYLLRRSVIIISKVNCLEPDYNIQYKRGALYTEILLSVCPMHTESFITFNNTLKPQKKDGSTKIMTSHFRPELISGMFHRSINEVILSSECIAPTPTATSLLHRKQPLYLPNKFNVTSAILPTDIH